MTPKNDRWLLPEGIVELLPAQAQQLEQLRRRLLDTFNGWGYELVMPPLIEYLESLQVGTGNDLDLQTFKLTDQLTGRLMGVRADMTPQVARIDAHVLKRDLPTRLCYIGPVLHTRPSGFARARAPLQVGAELYGHAGIESDVEILRLMVETLKQAGVDNIHIDLGHVGIYRELVKEAGLSAEQEVTLFEALQRKAKPEIDACLAQWSVKQPLRRQLAGLVDLNGDRSVLERAREVFGNAGAGVQAALENLTRIAETAARHIGDLPLYFDLAELRGYRYQTGVVFAAFVPGHGQEIARGGRYDDIGKAFGRARPATGFSSDLKTLVALSQNHPPTPAGIFAPAVEDAALDAKIAQLRAQGERVVAMLPGQTGEAADFGCDRRLAQGDTGWDVMSV
ncbi:ATP phosphoribosyltransferase regulatory subunit [Candidatus Tenderia electrophaga]|uniref:ATP phosphoribosyltransferase regulatory subunit n=1 Tax=Candidatus Tenderia electrophaga TaxID=1748243 RepID=A0A0S2THV4_9GAMM|nr:ATP phosphoribosyltransferase regulatory subunit [Candidatus Tenderia electrophaga]